MKNICIVSAMDSEIDYLLQVFNNYEVKEVNKFKVYEVKLENINLIISKSGIGKLMAGMLISSLNQVYKIDYVINTGICGARYKHSKLGDMIAMDKCCYGDFDISPITNNSFGQASSCPRLFESDRNLLSLAKDCLIGDIITKDLFVTSFEETEYTVNTHFSDLNVLGYDMESAAFSHACYFYGIPFIAIRCCSDVVGVTSTDEYNENEVDICKKSSIYLLNYIKEVQKHVFRW